MHANRGKRSIVLDLKLPEGREALLRLARTADVLFYNVRPQAMARLGLSYEDVAAVNPAIIYAGVFGYGQDGPYAARPAYRSEEHTSELQSLMRISYDVFCLKKNKNTEEQNDTEY